MNQTRVKNSTFGKQDFSVRALSIFLNFFLFERASQDAGHQGVLFFKYLLFKRKKGITSSMIRKDHKKWLFFYRHGFLYNNKKAYFKKRTLWCPASKHALSNKNKI